MPNEHTSPKQYDILDQLETGKKLAQERLEALKAQNIELYEILEKSNQLRDAIKVKPSTKFARSSQVRLFYRVVEPRIKPTFIESIRQSIQAFRAQFTIQKPMKLSPVYTTILVIILSFSFLVGGARAADNAGPGDFLYPVDLALENAQFFLTRSADHRLQLQMGFAQERLAEAEEAYAENDPEHAEEALAGYENQLLAISDLQNDTGVVIPEELQQIIDESQKNNTSVLVDLLDKVPESAQPAILHAIGSSAKPRGLEDKVTPPGRENKDTPPGLENKDTPPGQEDKDTPPGQEDKDKDTPPGLIDNPGLDDKDTPPGLEKKTPVP